MSNHDSDTPPNTDTDTDSTASETPDDTIAPTDDTESVVYHLERLFANAYPERTTLQYHDHRLTHTTDGVWTIQHEDAPNPIDVLNLDGFRSAVELETYLRDLAECDPDSRAEWREHRQSGGDRQ